MVRDRKGRNLRMDKQPGGCLVSKWCNRCNGHIDVQIVAPNEILLGIYHRQANRSVVGNFTKFPLKSVNIDQIFL